MRLSAQVLQRSLLATTFVALLSSALPAAMAGTAENPEILDPAGDVSPFSLAMQLPPDAALPQHAELYDLVKAYIAGEDRDGITLRLVVADLPDDWILEKGPAGAPPIDPISVAGQNVSWDDRWFNSKVNLTAFFTVHGKEYRAVVTLAEVNLERPGEFPAVYSREIIVSKIADARTRIADQSEAVQALLLPSIGPLDPKRDILDNLSRARTNLDAAHALLNESAKDIPAEDKEIVDERIDTSRLALSLAKGKVETYVPAGAAKDHLKTGFDTLNVRLGEVALIVEGLPEVRAPGAGDLPPTEDPSAPRVLLFHQFHLFDAQGRATALEGLLDLEGDFAQVRIPKDKIDAPQADDLLTKFRAASTFRSTLVMDFAPDAINPAPTDSAQALVIDAATGQLVKPAFGLDYRFLYAAGPAPSTGPSGVPIPMITMDAVGAQQKEIQPGGVATYQLWLRNAGSAAASGLFSLSPAEDGWTHQLSESDWNLDAGDSLLLTLTVSGIEGGAERQVSSVLASVQGGDVQSVDFSTMFEEASEPSPVPGPKGKSPGLGTAFVLATLAAVVVAWRRRTA